MPNVERYADDRLIERVIDHGDGTRTVSRYDPETGNVTAQFTEDCAVPEATAVDAVLEAVQNAREAVAGFSQNSGTRQAIEKLADAVTTLIT